MLDAVLHSVDEEGAPGEAKDLAHVWQVDIRVCVHSLRDGDQIVACGGGQGEERAGKRPGEGAPAGKAA